MPDFFRHELGFGTADDVAPLVAYLAADEARDITGQAIGAGGDRLQLWTHPDAAATEYRQGGWTYADLEADFHALFGQKLQSVGEEFLPLPAELAPEAAGAK